MSGRPRILGAILAGGGSSRFGSDKAVAMLGGRPLIAHVLSQIRPHVDDVEVVGRAWGELRGLPDQPRAGLGPLGGLCGALRHARARRYDLVFSVSCDTPVLPPDLVGRLAPMAPACVEGHPLIGCWPSGLAAALEAHLAASHDRSVRGWARACGARSLPFGVDIPNVNTVADLQALSRSEVVE